MRTRGNRDANVKSTALAVSLEQLEIDRLGHCLIAGVIWMEMIAAVIGCDARVEDRRMNAGVLQSPRQNIRPARVGIQRRICSVGNRVSERYDRARGDRGLNHDPAQKNALIEPAGYRKRGFCREVSGA